MKNDLLSSLAFLFDRDLRKLESEIGQYRNDEDLWIVDREIKNSGGNLCMHLCGNLQNYIGAVLGNSGYVRNREKEFSVKGLSKNELKAEIVKTRETVENVLEKLKSTGMPEIYPEEVLGYPMTTSFFLVHLYGHLNYHLGQINYHRRILCAQ